MARLVLGQLRCWKWKNAMQSCAALKAREPRKKVNIPARMRLGSEWADICIRNMSSRGLMATTAAQVKSGSYVEIRRGTIMIVGRVVWVYGASFGLRTQEQLDLAAVVGEPRLNARPRAACAEAEAAERRSEGRRSAAEDIVRQAERSRRFANTFQFVALVAAIVLGCATIALTLASFLSDVSSEIQIALQRS
jgi:hypothetical protein